jgi:hypothetical protein
MARAEISAFLTSCSYGEKCVGALTLAFTQGGATRLNRRVALLWADLLPHLRC